MQLDLFAHGRDVMLQNDVIAALRERDVSKARAAIANLAAEFPDHGICGPAALLCEVLALPETRFSGRDEIAAELLAMDTTIVPAAIRVFGPDEALGWLAPVWRSLAKRAQALAFHAEVPRAHSAYLSLQGGDWAAAETQIATVPSWRRIPVTLAWMVEAGFHRGGLESVWPLLAELAWSDAARLGELARRLKSPPLHKLLKDFEAGLDDEGELDASWFPAWLLITAPELASVMRQSQAGSGKAPERVARVVMELLALEKQGRHADLVAQRRKLRDLQPALYRYYMSTR